MSRLLERSLRKLVCRGNKEKHSSEVPRLEARSEEEYFHEKSLVDSAFSGRLRATMQALCPSTMFIDNGSKLHCLNRIGNCLYGEEDSKLASAAKR